MSLDLYERETLERLSGMAPVQNPEPSAFDGFIRGTGLATMRGLAKTGRAIDLLGSIGPIAEDAITGGTTARDKYFAEHDEVWGSAVDYWTPKRGEVGVAGEVTGQLLSVLPMVFASPGLAVGSAYLDPAEELAKKGVDAKYAQAVGALQATGLGLGIWMPILGQNLWQRVLVGGAGFNVLQGVATRGASEIVLKGTPGEGDFKAFDGTAVTLDVLLGLGFGGFAHISPTMRAQGKDTWDKIEAWAKNMTPEQLAAVATLREAQHLNVDSAPGKPVDEEALEAHVDRVKQAMEQMQRGQPVEVSDIPQPRFEPDADRLAEMAVRARELVEDAEAIRVAENLPHPETGLPEAPVARPLMAEHVAALPPPEQARAIGEGVAARLRALELPEQEAVANGAIWEAFFRTAADRYGVAPAELMQKYGLDITRMEAARPGALSQALDDTAKGGYGPSREPPDPQSLDFTAGGEPTAPARHLGGSEASQGWHRETRIRGSDDRPLLVYRGAQGKLGPADFAEGSLGAATGNPTSALGVWSTRSKAEAGTYGPEVSAHYLDMRRPKYFRVEDLPQPENLDEARQIRAELQAQGHDGIVVDARHLGGEVHFVSFKPEGVIPQEPGRTFFQSENRPTFYSALERAIETSPTKAAPAQGWKDWLRGQVQKGAIKADEVKWTGIEEWLELQQGRVTKEAVQAFLAQNGVKVTETMLGGTNVPSIGDARIADDVRILRENGYIPETNPDDDRVIAFNDQKYGDIVMASEIRAHAEAAREEANSSTLLPETRKELADEADRLEAAWLAAEHVERYWRGTATPVDHAVERMRELGYDAVFAEGEVKTLVRRSDGARFSTDPEGPPAGEQSYLDLPEGDVERAASELFEAVLSEQQHGQGEAMPLGTKFGQYTLPGAKEGSYRELLLTLPPKPEKPTGDVYHIIRDQELNPALRQVGIPFAEDALRRHALYESQGRIAEWAHDLDAPIATRAEAALESAGYSDLLRRFQDSIRKAPGQRQRPFESSHFNEANILAHVRFNERVAAPTTKEQARLMELAGKGVHATKAEVDEYNELSAMASAARKSAAGERVLFIEEIQSDWAQQGKKKGFSDPTEEARLKKELEESMNDSYEAYNEARNIIRNRASQGRANSADELLNLIHKQVGLHGEQAVRNEYTFDDTEWAALTKWLAAQKREDAAEQAVSRVKNSNIPAAPFVGKTDAWVALTLKRMIRYAAEHGFDRVAWTSGEQQVSRYTNALRKAVDSIEWKKTPEGVQLVGYKGKIEGALGDRQQEFRDAIHRHDQRINEIMGNNDLEDLPRAQRAIVDELIAERVELAELLRDIDPGTPSGINPMTVVRAKRALIRNDSLGFDNPVQAMNAVRSHPADWATRWEVPDASDRHAINAYVAEEGAFVAAHNRRKAARQKVVDTTEKEDVLSDAIGKAMADRIINDPNQSGTIEGENIKIDDTGMASFYDRIVPNVAKDVLKKLGGGKISKTELETGTETGKPQVHGTDWLEPPRPMDANDQQTVAGAQNFATADEPPIYSEVRIVVNKTPVDVAMIADRVGVQFVGELNGAELVLAIHREQLGHPDIWTPDQAVSAMHNIMNDTGELTGSLWDKVQVLQGTFTKRAQQLSFEITPAMRAKALEGQPLFQPAKGQIQFGNGQTIIDLFQKADASTFPHETGHLFLEITKDLAARPDAPEGALQDWATLSQWLKIEGGEIPREAHEQFARGFEAYLAEGRAPTEELRSVFQRFRDWLLEIYHSVAALRVELNDDVRGVIDRMLASKAEDPSPPQTEGPPAQRSASTEPPPPPGEAGAAAGTARPEATVPRETAMSVQALRRAMEPGPLNLRRREAREELERREAAGESAFRRTVPEMTDKQLATILTDERYVPELKAEAMLERDRRAERDAGMAAILAEPQMREDLQALADEAGWAQIGGRYDPARAQAAKAAGETGVVAFTEWIPKAEWWPGRPDNLNEAQTKEAVRKALAGETLKAAEKRMVGYLIDQAHDQRNAYDAIPPEEAQAIERDWADLEPQAPPTHADVVDADLVARAAALDEAAVERAAQAFENDTAAFLRAVRGIIDANEATQNQAAAGGGQENRGAPGAGEAPQPAGEPAGAQAPGTAQPAGAGKQSDPVRTEAERFVAENPGRLITIGTNPDGTPIVTTAAEYLANARQAAADAREDIGLIEVAAGCLLGRA